MAEFSSLVLLELLPPVVILGHFNSLIKNYNCQVVHNNIFITFHLLSVINYLSVFILNAFNE